MQFPTCIHFYTSLYMRTIVICQKQFFEVFSEDFSEDFIEDFLVNFLEMNQNYYCHNSFTDRNRMIDFWDEPYRWRVLWFFRSKSIRFFGSESDKRLLWDEPIAGEIVYKYSSHTILIILSQTTRNFIPIFLVFG